VPVTPSGARLFVAGHDPERDGRIAYRGRVGQSASRGDVPQALRLATANALASARAFVGSLDHLRCAILVAFVSSETPDGLDPALLADSLALLEATLPPGDPPAVWLRPAQGLAGGMLVEVELVLEARHPGSRAPVAVSGPARRARTGGAATARAPGRSGARTS
jgi:hypothetical protein